MCARFSLVFLVLIVALCASARAGAVIHWTPTPQAGTTGPTPSPVNSSAPGLPVVASFIELLRHGTRFNETVSVPVMERADAAAPQPAMVAANAFVMPLALQTCRGLVADLVLFRQLGRAGANYRAPLRTTLWLFADTAVSGHFNRSRALAERVFAEPSEGRYDPVGSTGGQTVDHGGGYYYHVERLRFVLGNLTLRSNTTYWLAALVTIERAYNASDFSQNAVRWAVAENVTAKTPYRVVDWHHNLYRDVSALVNWTSATIAEQYVLASLTSLSAHASNTHQLALDVYATECTNVTRLPASIVLLRALPVRDATFHLQAPAESPSLVPSLVPTSPDVMTQAPSVVQPPHDISPSPEAPDVPVVPAPAVPSPSFVPPPPASSFVPPPPALSSPSPSPTSPWALPLPTPPPASSSTPSPVPTPEGANISRAAPPTAVATSVTTWVIVGIAALAGILIVIGALLCIARYFKKHNYTDTPYKDYYKEATDKDVDDHSSVEELPHPPRYSDQPSILADDFEDAASVPLDDIVPQTRADAEHKQSMLTMQEVKLDAKK
jgi:hypothetical protein